MYTDTLARNRKDWIQMYMAYRCIDDREIVSSVEIVQIN